MENFYTSVIVWISFTAVLNNLPNVYQFTNKADIGGKYQGEWVIGNSTWLTTIYAVGGKLPKTEY